MSVQGWEWGGHGILRRDDVGLTQSMVGERSSGGWDRMATKWVARVIVVCRSRDEWRNDSVVAVRRFTGSLGVRLDNDMGRGGVV